MARINEVFGIAKENGEKSITASISDGGFVTIDLHGFSARSFSPQAMIIFANKLRRLARARIMEKANEGNS